MKIVKRAAKVVVIVLLAFAVFVLGVFIYHRICLDREDGLITQYSLGQPVEIDGHKMSIYTEGSGDKTLVFMSGAGTCSPILDFKSLYSLLSDEYRIVVVEKYGYGFSDVVDKQRDIDSMLSDTRSALNAAGIEAPYILCPHSMSGLEALYWAQQYPQEVSAIIGLDMSVPQYYDNMSINLPLMRVAQFAAEVGFTRIIPGIAESDAIKNGTLTDEEKELYRAIFYRRTATVTMINETKAVKENAKKVGSLSAPQLPMLLFISDGSGGTGFDEETWRSIPKEYLSGVENGSFIELNCPHYVHDHEYQTISKEIKLFLSEQ